MPAKSEEDRIKLLKSTHTAATALVEDLDYFRKVLDQPEPNSGELRRLTGSLRRILIDQDITSIAGPRIGKIHFQVNDTKQIVSVIKENTKPWSVYINGGAPKYFGMNARNFLMVPVSIENKVNREALRATIALDLNGFLSQKIVMFAGVWLPRKALLRYIAYVGSGVHSGKPLTQKDKEYAPTIEALRKAVIYNKEAVDFNRGITPGTVPDPNFRFGPEAVDCVLMEMLATLQFIVTSSDVLRLEEIIRAEN